MTTWAEALAPIIEKLDVAAKFNGNATFNPDGSRALALLLRGMERKLRLAQQFRLHYGVIVAAAGLVMFNIGFIIGRYTQ